MAGIVHNLRFSALSQSLQVIDTTIPRPITHIIETASLNNVRINRLLECVGHKAWNGRITVTGRGGKRPWPI